MLLQAAARLGCRRGWPGARPPPAERSGRRNRRRARSSRPASRSAALDLGQAVAPLVLEEDVVAAPQEAEGRHRHQEMRAGRHLGRVVADQAHVVVDMLQHVHHQHEVAVGRAACRGDRAPACRRRCRRGRARSRCRRRARTVGRRLGQQMAGEEARAGADIEQALRPQGGRRCGGVPPPWSGSTSAGRYRRRGCPLP